MLRDNAAAVQFDRRVLVAVKTVSQVLGALVRNNLALGRERREHSDRLVVLVKDRNDDRVVLHLPDGPRPVQELVPCLVLVRLRLDRSTHRPLRRACHLGTELRRVPCEAVNSRPHLVELIDLAPPSREGGLVCCQGFPSVERKVRRCLFRKEFFKKSHFVLPR